MLHGKLLIRSIPVGVTLPVPQLEEGLGGILRSGTTSN